MQLLNVKRVYTHKIVVVFNFTVLRSVKLKAASKIPLVLYLSIYTLGCRAKWWCDRPNLRVKTRELIQRYLALAYHGVQLVDVVGLWESAEHEPMQPTI